jgi:glucan biosynthesis protein C
MGVAYRRSAFSLYDHNWAASRHLRGIAAQGLSGALVFRIYFVTGLSKSWRRKAGDALMMHEETVLSQTALTREAVAETRTSGRSRLLYVDNMRVALITLVIVGHMAITYGAPFGNWYYREGGEVGEPFAVIAILLLGIGASFLLGLFFMIAGYFTPGPYDRKGAGRFIMDRLIRLGIPLVLYAFVINPLVTYWAAIQGGFQGSLVLYVSTHLPDLQNASVGPLWFVEALLIFSICYALGRLASGKEGEQRARPVPGNRSIALFALGLGCVTFLVRIWAPFGWWWEPLHQELAHLPQYITLFAVGIIAYRNNWFSQLTSTQARIWRWGALALIPGLPVLAVAAGALRGDFDPAVAGGFTWLSLAYSLWEAFIGVALVITTLVWFRDSLDHQGKVVREMSASAYAVYVLHPLFIVPLALAFSGVRLSLELKFILVTPLAVAICFLAAYLMRQIPILRRVL